MTETSNSSDDIIARLYEKYNQISKAQVNHKKCPKQRLTLGYLAVRMQCLDEYWGEFKKLHNQLIAIVKTPEERKLCSYFEQDIFGTCEEIYLTLKADMQDLVNTHTQQSLETLSPNPSPATSSFATCERGNIEVKLPRINLPKYSGIYEEWQSFEDTFSSLIDTNKSLTDVQKLHYLKSCLVGEASAVIKQYQVTEANFKPAYEALKQRYSHKRLIVNAILNRLFTNKKVIGCSASQLKSLIDTTKECLNSLNNMAVSTKDWDPVLIHFMMQRLDSETHKEWEDYVSRKCKEDLPNLTMLMTFLETRIHTLELTASTSARSTRTYHVAATDDMTTAVTAAAPASRACSFCEEDHALWHCKVFAKRTPEERSEYVRGQKLCYNCLLPGHTVIYCKLNACCKLCGRRHHSLLHQNRRREFFGNSRETESAENSLHTNVEGGDLGQSREHEPENVALVSNFVSKKSTTALLATALVPVNNEVGNRIILRALIDQGSQASFITERAAQLLKVKRAPVKGKITGVGSSETTVNHVTHLEIRSRYDSNFRADVRAYIMSTKITSDLPTRQIQPCNWSHIEGLSLADPGYYQPGRIDMLLGIDVYTEIIKGNIIKGPPGSPSAHDTHLGWILFGCVDNSQTNEEVIAMHHQINVDDMLKQMWEIETTDKRKHTAEEILCEKIYQEHTSRLDDGRYEVKLPTKTDNLLSTKGDTRNIAVKRLNQLERKFDKNPGFKAEYVKVIDEYLTLEHLEKVPDEEKQLDSVYLPHHAVLREDKETTKLRVVFDASCKGSNNVSLNDELLVGPQLQEDLRNLIMRWRMKHICYIADCQQMYRKILVKKDDSNLQRIVWRDNPTQPIQDYRLRRVTFGTASAPYLAVKTLHQVADDEGNDYPDGKRTIKEDFYVDDLMSGSDTLEEAIKTASDVINMLNKGGFKLQKWGSNSADFLKQIEPSQRTTHANVDLKVQGTVKALGLSWNMGDDVLHYHVELPSVAENITKRNILADIQRLFDPLGWIGPAIIQVKMLIQKLWMQRVDWDENIVSNLRDEWLSIRHGLDIANKVRLQRWHNTTKDCINVSIHGFCDSSTKGYAAVAYMRVEAKNGDIVTGIIGARTRVAPVKPVSLPRLELSAALLLSRLLKQVIEATRIPNHQVFMWSDSKIVLSWIHGDPARWNVFVSNRVVEILENIGNKKWNHVRSEENPADVASRGTSMEQLVGNRMWWHGPEWLKTNNWPIQHKNNEYLDDGELEQLNLEKKKIHINTKIDEMADIESKNLFEGFDTLVELQRTIVLAKRFINSKRRPEDIHRDISAQDLDMALNTCVKKAQQDEFSEEIQDLTAKKCVKSKSVLLSLNPFLDNDNIVRVGGRLRHADLSENTKHPVILGHNNFLVPLIIAEAHKRTLHGGYQLMLSYLRTQYWIIRVKSLVKQYVHKCFICARQRAATKQQLMGDYPEIRVIPTRAFLHSGVDMAGPYQILSSRGRGTRCTKGYIAIFVCMSTKAIHLELVGDMSSASFIGAFERFVARRGRCRHIWSDQGTNFVGANKQLQELWNEAKVNVPQDWAELLVNDGVQWHFNPPYSPNFGGLWEAGVKSIKFHLKRILDRTLTFEEFSTTLCQIEACLNSRPLCPIDTTDTENIDVLTPGHFLVGEPPIVIPNPDLSNVVLNRLSHWQHTQQLVQHFWRRWQSEYLTRLQQRPKWQKTSEEFRIGDVVLVKEDNLPPGKWALGRIINKHPGADGLCRVYSIKSQNKIIRRSLSKICQLPINDD